MAGFSQLFICLAILSIDLRNTYLSIKNCRLKLSFRLYIYIKYYGKAEKIGLEQM